MIIEFYTPDTGVDNSIITYVRDEIIKLHKQHGTISRADISFRQKTRHSSLERMCEISLFIAGSSVNAKGVCKNFDHASRKAIAVLNENLIASFRQKVHAL